MSPRQSPGRGNGFYYVFVGQSRPSTLQVDSALILVLASSHRVPFEEPCHRWHVKVSVLVIQSPLTIFRVLATAERHFCRPCSSREVSCRVSFAGPGS